MVQNDDFARIVAGCKNGHSECFSQLVDVYASRCYAYFYRLTGSRDVSDELLSELFLKVVTKIGSYKGGAFESWIFRVASNIFHDHLRTKHRQAKLLETHAKEVQEEQTPEAKKSDADVSDRLQKQLSKLDAGTRELIMLRFYSELPLREIAQMRSEPIGTTLSKLHRAMRKLREMME